MSGLGTTMSPTGETGTVSKIDTHLEQLPSNPSQIAQDTSIEGVSHVLERDWIWKETVSVSTTMSPGTVFSIMPIHPFQCNRFVRHVAQMFNCWTGGMHIRLRMMATAFYGGSLRVGFLPPNLTPTQIRNMPLDVLTVYPNNDFDPKNTNWVHFSTTDERDVAFHYMSNNADGYDPSDKRSFGGYIVLFVAGRLVTQSPEISSINIVVETAGNFEFSQINPQFGLVDYSDQLGSLTGEALLVDNWIPADVPTFSPWMKLGILEDTVTNINVGGFKMQPWLSTTLENTPGITIGPATSGIPTTNFKLVNENYGGYPSDTATNIARFIDLYPGFSQQNVWDVENNVSGSATTTSQECQILLDPTGARLLGNTCRYALGPGSQPSGLTMNANGTVFSVYNEVLDTSTWATFILGSYSDAKFEPLTINESILTVFSSAMMAPALQPLQFKRSLLANPCTDAQVSELYNLRNADGTILTVVRLQPNGMMTVPAAPRTVISILPGMRLDFLQTLPINAPIPSALYRMSRKNLKRLRLMTEISANPGAFGLDQHFADMLLE